MIDLHRPADLLQVTDHRPWPLPEGRWNFLQEWREAIFVHFPVDPARIRSIVPPQLDLDLIDGQAWISLVAFTMRNVRPRSLPSWSLVSDFHELNVRTYVRGPGGRTGVYFFSIEAGKWISVVLARALSVLPYQKATIRRGGNGPAWFEVSGNGLQRLRIEYRTTGPISTPGVLDRWLVERYALFERHRHDTWCYEIHHVPWPLSTLTLEAIHVPAIPGLPALSPLVAPAVSHFSSGVRILSWPPYKVR